MKTLKISYLILLLFFLLFETYAQEWQWAADISCTANAQPNVASLDNNGNMIVFMVFEGGINVGGRTIGTTGSKDMLLSKFSSNGDTIWNKAIGSIGNDVPRRMTITNADEILITGGFSGACDFDAINLTNTYASEDIFLAKYSSDGTVQWARNIAWGPDQDRSSGIVLDEGGNIGLVGFFRDSIFFESDTLISSGGVDNFFAKFDEDGDFLWAIHYPGTSNTIRLNEISLSNDNAFLISGFYDGTLTAQSEILTSSGSADILLIKADTAGNELWIRTAGGVSDDRGINAATDIYGNAYLVGYFTSTINFDSLDYGLRESSPLISKGSNDMFIAKYNKNGTLQWITQNGDNLVDRGQGIKVYNNILQFTGFFTNKVVFGNDTLVSSNASNDAGVFIYNTNGDAIKGVSVAGSDEDRGTDVFYDETGYTYLTGYYFSDTLRFGDLNIIKSATGIRNPFLAKYAIPFSVSFTDETELDCHGDTDGSLTITPYFGMEPYLYNWSHDGALNDSVATGLSAGMYSVTVTDGRDSTAYTSITLGQPDSLDISGITTDVSCHPDNGESGDGAIDITVAGGTVAADYTYTWEAISGSGVNATSPDQNSLTMGQYSVTVTDDNLCTKDTAFVISQPDPIVFTGSIMTPATGGLDNGAIDLNPSGGNDDDPYTFAWSNLETTEDISGLFAGNYTVTVTDILSCEQDTTFLVTDAAAFLAFIIDQQDVDCYGNSTGEATVGTSGGTPPYTYEWTNSGGTPVGGDFATLSDVPAGTYYVTVTNSDLRTAEAFTTINEPDAALSAFITPTDLTCYGDNSGVADLTVSGGTLPYTFLWSNAAVTEDIVNIAAASYSVTITDNNECTTISLIEIEEPDPIVVQIDIDETILCYGDLSGVATADAEGGTGAISYVWDDPGNQTEATATNLGAGYYTVTATDINLCSEEESIQLTQPPELILSETHSNVSCYGTDDGIINLVVEGGSPGYNYDWSNGFVGQDPSDLSPGNYSVLVTDQNNCEADLMVDITEPEEIVQEYGATDLLCAGDNTGAISITGQGGAGGYEYSIDGGLSFTTESEFTGLSAGNYDVVTRDTNECETLPASVELSEPDPILVDTSITQPTSQMNGAILVTASGGTAPYTFILETDSGDSTNITGAFSNIPPGDYSTYVMDDNDCLSEIIPIVIILEGGDGVITIYNAFSPNGDGINDTWNISNIDQFDDCTVVIVNSWGTKVFESSGYTEPWDGTYNGNLLPSGTYYYIIDLGNGSEPYTGPVSIVR